MKAKKIKDKVYVYLFSLSFLLLSALSIAAMHAHKSQDGLLTFYYFFDVYTFSSRNIFYASKIFLQLPQPWQWGKVLKLSPNL